MKLGPYHNWEHKVIQRGSEWKQLSAQFQLWPGSNFIELLKHKNSLAQQNYAYQNKITNQTVISHVQFVTGDLRIYAKQTVVKEYFLLQQLYEIGPSYWIESWWCLILRMTSDTSRSVNI